MTKTKSKTGTLRFGSEEDLKEILAAEQGSENTRMSEDELAQYEKSIHKIEEGNVVRGKVVKITKHEAYVDINFKSEGVVSIHEFKDMADLKEGDEVDIYLEQVEDNDGQVVLSKQRADFAKVWEKIKDVHASGEVVRGNVTRKIKGGVVVDLFGIDAFLPGSQIDLRQIPDLDALVNKQMDVRVIKVNKLRRNVVVSRRIVLEEERVKMRGVVLSDIAKGQIRKGTVKNITDFGVFVDLGGVDGLLHITDMSWSRVTHPTELVRIGEEITVKILDYDEDKERISLGMKQLQAHPWEGIRQKYPEGSKVTGKIVNVTDYGAFMEIEKGIEGLIHISEMSWSKNLKTPKGLVDVGMEVEAIVLKIDEESEKISLGLKQLLDNPWDTIEMEFPIGKRVSGSVRNVTAFGAFIGLKDGIDGLVHVSDMSWTKKIKHPNEMLKKGDEVQCVVLSIDKDKKRVSLGMKQIEEDPWANLHNRYGVGTDVEAKIIRMLDRGVIVELEPEIEGFVPANKLGKGDIEKPASAFKEGDVLKLKVIEFDHENRKISLSVDDFIKGREKSDYENYSKKQGDPGSTLGDAFDFSKLKKDKQE
ncbi:MAG: 30S ribosomal protein S1 [Fibrobacteres bacterium]|nr:30S ribosomal protein S1 [Fibrobacterota bacterium]